MTLKANFRPVQDSSAPGQGSELEAVSFSPSQEDTMTDISAAAPITVRRLNLPRPSFPRLAIGASLAGMFSLVGDALNMAYVAPYSSIRRRPRVVPDDDLEGRDPTW
jgi:hypothetical protein